MAAHSFWRVLRINGPGTQYYGLCCLRFFASYDATGPSLAVGGTALAHASQNWDSLGPQWAFRPQADGLWQCHSYQGQAWIGYQFPQPVEINSYAILPNRDDPGRTFSQFLLQWSDDGITWVDEWKSYYAAWRVGSFETFHRPSLSGTVFPWWAVGGMSEGGGASMAGTNVELLPSWYGQDLTDPAAPERAWSPTQYAGQAAQYAFDGQPGTIFSGANDAPGWCMIGYLFPRPVRVEEVTWTARADENWYVQAPSAGFMYRSVNGRDWWPQWAFKTEKPWARGSRQFLRYGDHPPAPEPPPVPRRRPTHMP